MNKDIPERATPPKPSIGRIVHYADDAFPPKNPDKKAWCAGMIVHVHDDNRINLVYWDQMGDQGFREGVKLGDKKYCWRWPPRV